MLYLMIFLERWERKILTTQTFLRVVTQNSCRSPGHGQSIQVSAITRSRINNKCYGEYKCWRGKTVVVFCCFKQTPMGLVRAVIWKSFCLWGGQEHRRLRLSQLECLRDPDRYVYHEHTHVVLKSKQGGVCQLHLDHKVVTILANKDAKERCPVFIIDTYSASSLVWPFFV